MPCEPMVDSSQVGAELAFPRARVRSAPTSATSRRHRASTRMGSLLESFLERPKRPKSGLPQMNRSPLPSTATVWRAPQPTSLTVDERSRHSTSKDSINFGSGCILEGKHMHSWRNSGGSGAECAAGQTPAIAVPKLPLSRRTPSIQVAVKCQSRRVHISCSNLPNACGKSRTSWEI